MWRALLLGVIAACTTASTPAPPPAEPWSVADYEHAGVPEPDHPWSDVELLRAEAMIIKAATGHPERLPRHRGASSGAVFARVVEPAGPDDPSRPVGERFMRRMNRGEALDNLPDTQAAVRKKLAAQVAASSGPLHDDFVAAQAALTAP